MSVKVYNRDLSDGHPLFEIFPNFVEICAAVFKA
jgi:hypothetical protein